MKDAQQCTAELQAALEKGGMGLADAVTVGLIAVIEYCKRLERRIEELEGAPHRSGPVITPDETCMIERWDICPCSDCTARRAA